MSSFRRQVLCREFWASGCLFLFFSLKHTQKHKNRTGKYIPFLVTDRLDRYLYWRPIYLNLINYITSSVIVNKLQYINSYFQLKYGLLIQKLINDMR